ncbi:MAG: carboxypeptidase-like regulatory domain-containing protein [Tenuifilaceae bacterium]|jgi:hypothetical protein|nr:carboxypeptidase-like regulatory domain-containing protein [Tenuifilaceae bacterium]
MVNASKNTCRLTTRASRIVRVFLLIAILSRGTWGMGQSSGDDLFSMRVTIPSQRTTVYKALNQLADSIGFQFAYDSRLVDNDRRIRPQAQNVELRRALHHILGDSLFLFTVYDNHILIHRKKETIEELETQQPAPLSYTMLRGRVLDSQTLKPISYVTVGIPEMGLGSITNQEGFFQLKIPLKQDPRTISLMHLGYKTRKFPVELLAAEPIDIFLEADVISIQEVIIRNVDPKQLLRDAFARIPDNYSAKPVYLTSFYREGVVKNDKYQNYSEAIFKIYKSSYTRPNETDQVKQLKSRKTQNLEPADTLSIKLRGGINSSLTLDLVKHPPFYLEEEFLQYYNFTRNDIITIGDRVAYAIGFNLKEGVTEPLMEGVLYIDIDNLAILGADFKVSPQNIGRATDQYVYKRNRRFRLRPVSISYSVRYKSYDGVHHLSHVRGDLKFRYRYRRSLFNNSFHLFFELVNTQIETDNVVRFDRRELEPMHNVFLDNSWVYDQVFWNDLNIIPPEKSVFDALNDINAKIEEVRYQ